MSALRSAVRFASLAPADTAPGPLLAALPPDQIIPMIRQMNRLALLVSASLLALEPSTAPAAQQPTPLPIQARVDAELAQITQWASDPVIVAAVRAHNAALPADEEAIDQERWHSLATLDPLVRRFTQNAVGRFLSGKLSAVVGEAMVSDASGRKVGFVTKPTRWRHAGQPKHDQPLAGHSWQGRIEVDDSTGLRLIQVAVPVLDAGQPIGSLVVGLSVAALTP